MNACYCSIFPQQNMFHCVLLNKKTKDMFLGDMDDSALP